MIAPPSAPIHVANGSIDALPIRNINPYLWTAGQLAVHGALTGRAGGAAQVDDAQQNAIVIGARLAEVILAGDHLVQHRALGGDVPADGSVARDYVGDL